MADWFATQNVTLTLPVPAEFVAFSVTVKLPPMVGVPEIRPVEVFTDSPGGRFDAPNEVTVGVPLAVI